MGEWIVIVVSCGSSVPFLGKPLLIWIRSSWLNILFVIKLLIRVLSGYEKYCLLTKYVGCLQSLFQLCSSPLGLESYQQTVLRINSCVYLKHWNWESSSPWNPLLSVCLWTFLTHGTRVLSNSFLYKAT